MCARFIFWPENSVWFETPTLAASLPRNVYSIEVQYVLHGVIEGCGIQVDILCIHRPVLSILPTSVFPWMEKRIHSCVIRVNNASVILKCVCQVCHCVTLNYFRWNSFSKESEE